MKTANRLLLTGTPLQVGPTLSLKTSSLSPHLPTFCVPEQLARAVGAAELPASGGVLLRRGLRRVVQHQRLSRRRRSRQATPRSSQVSRRRPPGTVTIEYGSELPTFTDSLESSLVPFLAHDFLSGQRQRRAFLRHTCSPSLILAVSLSFVENTEESGYSL